MLLINVLEAPSGALFTEGQNYPVYGTGSSPSGDFVFDDNVEPYFLGELKYSKVEEAP